MAMDREGGYTLVEAAIAIAVSASLIILTAGMVGMVGQQRFKDSMATAQSFIQTQYNEVRSGINSRLGNVGDTLGCNDSTDEAAAASSNDCYIAGRYIAFKGENISSNYVVLKKTNTDVNFKWPNSKKSAMKNLTEGVTLYVLTGNNNDAGLNPLVKNIGYGSKIERVWYINGESVSPIEASDSNDPNIALLRSPLDGALLSLADVQLSDSPYAGIRTMDLAGGSVKSNMLPAERVALGVVNGSWGGAGDGLICIAGGDNSTGISNDFNVGLNWSDADGGDNQTKIKTSCKNWEVGAS